ncbi:hypothetical protein GCM10022254_10030 [Actinomadura meridiana]|uniref:Uncharacterized protein n=1 Tax=Actinomadura meridiana TaxID=559626 RepID=A0ABP8BU52_9ACTN
MSHDALVGADTSTATTDTGVITVDSAVSTGKTVTAAVVWESGAGTIPTVSSVTDTRGNTWTVDKSAGGGGNATVATMIARARIATALQVGDTITIVIGENRVRWAMQADAFDDVDASPLDKTAANNNPGNSAALSSGVTAATAQAYELAVAVFGFGQGRTTTIPAGWSGTAKVETTAGSTDRALQVIYKYTAATGTQEGTLTLSSGSTYTGLIATYKATAVAPATKAGPPRRRPQLRNLLIR